jgi:hypothetical protein
VTQDQVVQMRGGDGLFFRQTSSIYSFAVFSIRTPTYGMYQLSRRLHILAVVQQVPVFFVFGQGGHAHIAIDSQRQ